MSVQASNNRRIAKNTMMLYIRMLLSIVVSLYTSRVVLEVLGVEDYGIYGVVGGVVAMFSFLNFSMAGATSRFLTFEMGRRDEQRLRDTFSSALLIHIGIAVLVFILAETVGLWFLCQRLVIPENRMGVAHWVYQCSVISSMLSITQVPYNASIIAHEKMDVYAYIEILNVTLKLFIVYLLTIGDFDKLILYSVLVLSVSVIVMMTYRVYCMRNFSESHFRAVWRKDIVYPMLSFSGWDFYGNMSVVLFTQGTNVILNMFVGPIVNAANNIAITVQGVIKGLAYNIIQAFRPQIFKQYAKGNMDVVNQYCVLATQYSLLLFSLISVPLFWKAEYVLRLWLGSVPEYTVCFLRIILIATMFNLANNVINIPSHACGKMKLFSIVTGTCFLLSLPIMYFVLKSGISVEIAYLTILLSYVLCLFCSIIVLKYNVPEINLFNLLYRGYLRYVICLVPGIILLITLNNVTSSEFVNLFIGVVINGTSLCICAFLFILDCNERRKFISWFLSKLKIH